MAKKNTSLAKAYLNGWWHLILGGAAVVGGVFAWRIANMLFDKMIEKKEK